MEQLLLMTSCDSPAGIGASLQTDAQTQERTHRHDIGNSILDEKKTCVENKALQLLLLTFCDSPAGIGASLQTDGRTHGRTDRREG